MNRILFCLSFKNQHEKNDNFKKHFKNINFLQKKNIILHMTIFNFYVFSLKKRRWKYFTASFLGYFSGYISSYYFIYDENIKMISKNENLFKIYS